MEEDKEVPDDSIREAAEWRISDETIHRIATIGRKGPGKEVTSGNRISK